MFHSYFSDLVVSLGQPEQILPLLVKSLSARECHIVYQEEVRNPSFHVFDHINSIHLTKYNYYLAKDYTVVGMIFKAWYMDHK